MRPSLNLGIAIVIPACDEDWLLFSLMSLHRCRLPKADVEVIVVINNSESASPAVKANNRRILTMAENWGRKHHRSRMRFHFLYYPDLPKKQAGVGLARKIGMDEAVFRYERVRNKKGIIACFDADSRCDPNYLVALETHFQQQPKTQACSIYFEHPLEGCEYPPPVYEAIAAYELHLRYYVQVQRYAGFPYAVDTIGSSMAVRADAYQQQGGMNRRKAGEDFYFLHKFTPLGHFAQINSTRVIPSPRTSDRVPFGTGKAVADLIRGRRLPYTYSYQTFEDLKQLFEQVPNLWTGKTALPELSLSAGLSDFLRSIGFEEKLAEIRANTRQRSTFIQRFWRWFDAFQIMKFVHYARDHYYPDIPVQEAARWLLARRFECFPGPEADIKSLLVLLREFHRKDIFNLCDQNMTHL